MTDFQIGDVVRLKSDGPDKLKMIVRNIDLTDGQILCRSECSNRIMWASPLSLELVYRPDPQADIKQAIREVLLSDEFMKAFAAAWMKTPLPLAMQYDSKFEIVNSAELASLPEAKPTTAQSLADRTLKAIWQANDSTSEEGKQ